MTPQAVQAETLVRLTARYVVTSQGCWEWCGKHASNGRGLLQYKGHKATAYRVSYMLHHDEELQQEETIDHLCTNKACVNPKHLEKCSVTENHRRDKKWTKPYVLRGAA